MITGASVGSQSTNLQNASGYRAGLQITSLGGLSGSTGLIAAGGSTALSASVSTGTVGRVLAELHGRPVGRSEPGGQHGLASQTFTVTGSVLDHALASLCTNSANFGTVITGASVGSQIDESAKRLGLPGRLADHEPRRLERQHGPDRGRRQHGLVGRGEHGHGRRLLAELHGRLRPTIRAWRATRPWPRRPSRSPARCSTMRRPA